MRNVWIEIFTVNLFSFIICRALAISLPVAREHLLTAEIRGVLCRDDGPEGLRFYRNFFMIC